MSFLVDSLEESFGGTAGNIAYNLALFGETPLILSSAGHDFDKYRDYFEKLHIPTDSVQLSELEPTAVAHIITDDEDNQISAFYPGALSQTYQKDIPQADLLIVAPGNAKDMVELSRRCREHSKPFFFDPGQQTTVLTAEEFRESLQGASILIGNDYEIALIQKKLETDMQGLLERVPVVVTTLGAEGTRVHTKENEFAVPSVKAIQVIDPTGAGDAYRAGFAAAWLRQLPLETCAQVASTVAVYAVEDFGTQKHRFTMDQLKARYVESYGSDFPW